MFPLLKIEWLKVKNYRTFWILLGLFAILLPLFNYQFSSGHIGGINMLGQLYGFPSVWGIFGYMTSWLVLFIAFLIIILITNEHQYRTNRQNVIDGWTRLQFFHAKCLIIVLLSLFTAIYAGGWSLIFGRIYGGSFDGATENINRLLYLFILSMNYYGFAAMIAFLIKRSGLAIGLFLLYSFVIENIMVWEFGKANIAKYLPLQSADELLPFEPMENITKMAGTPLETPTIMTYILASITFIAIYYAIGRYKISKSDL